MNNSEQDMLVLAAQQGNKQAFSYLCQFYHPSLLRFAYKLCGNQALAQDAVQDAWLGCSSSITKLKDPRAFKSWLYKNVRWRTLDLIRKQPSTQQSLDDNEMVILADSSAQSQLEDSEQLNYLLSMLNPIDRQAIYLFYLEQMKLSEISIVLDIPVGTVKSRLNRARCQLKAAFNDQTS